MIKLKQFFNRFYHAGNGIKTVFLSEQSFRVQCIAAVIAVILGQIFQIKTFEWIVILILIGSVLSLEIINSIFERIADTFKPRIHPMIKEMKDMMAAAVLLASGLSFMIGLIIFYPYLISLV